MALISCRQCRQPFYASCHDSSCLDALCPYCEYAEVLPREAYSEEMPLTDAMARGPCHPTAVSGHGGVDRHIVAPPHRQ
jgi:hypothetical protein